MKRKITIEFELAQEEFDAIQEAADLGQAASVEDWLRARVAEEVVSFMALYDPVISEEELRELRHEYGDDVDPTIPF